MADYEIKRKANIGSSSLIVIFIVLCLVTFGLLALGNARRDELLSQRNADAVREYYRADSMAVTFYQKVDECLARALADGKTVPEVKEQALGELGEYYNEKKDTFCTEISMKAGQALSVELKPEWAEGTTRVTVWKVYNREDYEIDQSIRVWDGQ